MNKTAIAPAITEKRRFTILSRNKINSRDAIRSITTVRPPFIKATTTDIIKTVKTINLDHFEFSLVKSNDNIIVPLKIQKSPNGVRYENTLEILTAFPTIAIPVFSSSAYLFIGDKGGEKYCTHANTRTHMAIIKKTLMMDEIFL